MTEMNERELSERDLLIRLEAQLRAFKEYTEKKFEDLEIKMIGISDIKTRVAVLESRAKSNDKFRNIVYGSIVASVLSIASSVIVYFLLK